VVHQLHHPDLHVIDQVAVQLAQVLMDHVVHLGSHLHTGGAAAHHHKGQKLLALLPKREGEGAGEHGWW
jgi:hypothetical protein